MSHITTCRSCVNNLQILQKTCEVLQREIGRTDVYNQPRWTQDRRVGESRVSGYEVLLPNWQHPVVFDLDASQAHFDNYEGRWGSTDELDKLYQRYSAETLQQVANEQGGYYTETQLDDGQLAVAIHVGE